jgi:hypothetical protein
VLSAQAVLVFVGLPPGKARLRRRWLLALDGFALARHCFLYRFLLFRGEGDVRLAPV